MPPKTNLKQQAGLAKKAENDAKKQAAIDVQRAVQEDAEWKQGSNIKKLSRTEELAMKQDEALQKRREREALLAAEEADGPSTTNTAKKALNKAKNSNKKKDDLGMLEDALVTAADKKMKQKKAAEAAAKLKIEQEAKLKAEKLAKEKASIDPLLHNTEQMIGPISDHDDLNNNNNNGIGREANKARMDANMTTGIDAALGALQVNHNDDTTTGQLLPSKVTYSDYEQRMLPIVKLENPGLRLSQYKEKVFNLWKKSPENPSNQIVS
jgi:membrane protein involved in colicin uptake